MGSFFTSTQIYNPNLLDREQFINFFCEEMKENSYVTCNSDESEVSYILRFSDECNWVTLSSEAYEQGNCTSQSDTARIARMLGTYCVNTVVIDSDCAMLDLYDDKGEKVDTAVMGRADDYLGEDIPTPAKAVWEQFLSADSTWEQFMSVVQGDYVFVEDGLSELAPVIEMDSGNILFEYADSDEKNENICYLSFKKTDPKKEKKLTLNAAFKQVFGEALEPLGFIKAKTRQPCFLRVVGDEIIHVISLPCCGARISNASGVMTVYRPQIDLNNHKWDNNWLKPTEKFYSKSNVLSFDEKYWNENLKIEYTLNNEESLINALKKALEEVKKWVLPMLDDVKTVKDIIDYQHRMGVTTQYFAVCDNAYLDHETPYSDGAILFALDDPHYYPRRVKELLLAQLNFEIEHGIHFFGKETYEETCERFDKNLAERLAQIDYVINNENFYKQTLAELERRKIANIKILNSYGLNL